MPLHPLLLQQLAQLGLDTPGQLPRADGWQALLQAVSHSYESLDAQRNTQRLQSLLSLSADWIWEQDEHLRFSYVSDGFEKATGMPRSSLLGTRRMADASFLAAPEAVAAYEAALANHQPFRDFTFRRTRPDGSYRWVRTSGEPVFDSTGSFRGYRGIGRDVTEAMAVEQRMQELARFDSLTGLPNRSMFLAELERTIARHARQGGEFALCFIDLDHFKTINDSLGHDAGDELLKLMAERLRNTVRKSDLVARLGGDEFVVLLEGELDAQDLSDIAHKLLAAIGEPMSLQGCDFQVGASIGVGLYPADGGDAATLLKHADAAMYLAKESGKNNVQFYTAALADMAARQFELESALRLALVRNELVLHYQPKVDVTCGRIVGLEALVRWQRPGHGLVPPGDFIPLAEERGLIVALGRWVMNSACRQIRDWRRAGLQPPPVAVNLSARQFADEGLIADLGLAMQRHEVLPAELQVELTESALMVDPERAQLVLRRLHTMGVRIAIDDFGTGYSSLSYLKRFPASTVKIDRSFIRGLPADQDDTAITQAVIAMAHTLGLAVVAEGVETAEQLTALRLLGCDEAQGYLLGRPAAAADIAYRLSEAPSAWMVPAPERDSSVCGVPR